MNFSTNESLSLVEKLIHKSTETETDELFEKKVGEIEVLKDEKLKEKADKIIESKVVAYSADEVD